MTTKDSIYYKFDSTGNYPVKLIISNPIGCVDSLVGLVPVVSPSADAGLSTAICRGSKVQLKASTGKSYKWWPSTGLSDTTISNPYASPVLTSTYYVEVVENSGCISVDSVTVFVKSVPVAYAGLDTVINFGDSITISAAPGGEFYAWDNGMTGMTISVAPAFSRSYSVFVTKNGCGAKDEITIFVDNSPLPSFSFTNKLFGILPEGPVGPDNCSSAAYLGISTIDPGTGTQIYGQCSNQVSTTYSGVTADRFRMIFGDQNLTYHENVDANRQKMIYTEGTASLQMDTTGSGTWKNILSLKNVSTIIEFICPDTLKGKMRGEISGGDPAFYAEYTSTGNNQILAEFTSLAIDSIYNDSLGNKLYTVYDYTFELLPVEKPVYVKGLGIVAPGDLLTFPSTGVSLDFNAYIASSDSASATVVYYPFDPPYTQAEDTIATVFNNEFWELGSTLDNFQVQVCFDYDSNEINTSDIQYLNLVYQEYIGGPWTIVSGVPVISGDQICVVTEHFSNWSLAITKPDARVKIDTIFSNQGADPEFVYKKFEDELNVGLKLTPGQNQNVEFRAFALNPGGDLPAGVKKFSETYWELHSDSDIESILEFNPASLAGYDSTTDDGKYTILYRPDAVTDWSALPTSRVRRGMKEVLIVKQSNLVSPTGERNYVLGNVDTVLELFSSSANVSPVCEGVSSQFMAQVSGGISPFSYSWTGDDGFTSTMETPEYTYPSGAGNYNYTLIVTDANGAETTFSGVAKVNALPQLLVSNDTLICKGESVTLTVSGAQDYFWNTGDSTSTIFTIPSNSSVYIVTGTDSNGCSSESVISVNVNTETAGISMPDTALTSELISFLNSSTGGTEWHWDFGDGNTSTEQNPQYSYSAIGTYPVCLTVDGCDSVCKSIIIKLKTSLDNVLQKQGYVVFPNPAGKKLNVVFNSQDYANTLVTLSDIYGKIIYKELAINRNENQQLQIDLSEISTGIYFLKIQTAKGSNIEKVVVR
ncbi:MAG: hypothetical protein A3G23_01725 [Bacteroidetes bacterium RIFCSPLOWO2_12_FULL_37_12]|nr:MAG: hypothetical protein A3G23_01725 [Bacteroidetes bacterium RIFCSPLOWO2_12_FULL_37_12]